MAKKLIVEVIGDTRSYERAMGRSSKATRGFEGSVSRMGGALKGLAKAGLFAAGALGAGGLALVIHAGTKELRDRQRVEAQTAAALKSTGNAANTSMKQIDALALSLSNLSGVDDEVIKSAQTMLLSFTNVRNEVGKGNDIFNRATRDILDFSVRTGRDASSAAVLLGKALQDPATKVSALARAGIVFSTEQKKVIASLVETGHTLEAQKLILTAIEQRYRGAAKAAGGTLAGRLGVLQERFKDLSGDLLTAFLPTLNQLVAAVIPIVNRFHQWTANSENQRRMQERVNAIVQVAVGIFKGMKDVVVPLAGAVKTLADRLGGARNAVKTLLAVMVAGKIVSFAGAITGLSTQMLVATGRAKALRLAMLRLGAIGVIAIGVELILNRDSIDKNVKSWLRSHGAGFLTSQEIKIPVNADIADVVKIRKQIADLKGENDLAVKAIDKLLAKMREAAGDPVHSAGRFRRARRAAVRAIKDDSTATATTTAPSTTATTTASSKAVEKEAKESTSAADKARIAAEKAAAALKKRNEAIRAAVKASQFKTLGLTGQGEERVPGVGSLKRLRGSLLDQIKGTTLDTSKTRQTLRRIKRVLSGEFGKVGKDVRSAILGMLNDIRSALSGDVGGGGGGGPLTKTHGLNTRKLAEGLGLTPEQERELRQRASKFNTAGRALGGNRTNAPGGSRAPGQRGPGEIVVESHTTINLDGHKLATVVTRNQQKDKRRNPRQKRGQHRG